MDRVEPQSSVPLGEDIGATAFVQGLALCKDVPEAAMESLYAESTLETYLPDDVMMVEGNTDSDLFVVLEGNVAIGRETDDEWLVAFELDRPAVFGEASALTEQPRMVSARAVTECRLIRIPGAVVRSVAEEAPKFGRRLAALMAARNKTD